MPRPKKPPKTALGAALRKKRGERPSIEVAAEIGISQASLSRVETGKGTITLETALALARWLGWTVEELAEASKEPLHNEET